MIRYFRWVVRQAYIHLFLPRALEQEHPELNGAHLLKGVEARFLYMGKLLPWAVVGVGLAIVLTGTARGAQHQPFFWHEAWAGAAIGMGGSLLVGLCFGVSVGVVQMYIVGTALAVDLGLGAGWFGAVIMGSAYGVLCGCVRPKGPAVLCALAVAAGGTILSSVTSGLREALFGLILYVSSFGAFFVPTFARLPDYPLHLLLDWICLVRTRARLEHVGKWWRCHPLAWNDTIRLPLPRAGAVLAALVRHDRAIGFQTIAWVAAERDYHRRSVHAALTQVILDDLVVTEPGEFGRVPENLEWLDRPSVVLRGEWTDPVPAFIRTARYVSQGLALNSRFRQLESLEKAVNELSSLRKALIGRSDTVSAMLLSRANEWSAIIQGLHTEVRQRASEEREIPQIFRFGNPVREDEGYLFAGRRDIVRNLESALLGDRHPPAILLHGARRMGKTSILLQLRRLLGPEFAPATIDCQSPGICQDLPSLLHAIARAVLRSLAGHGQLPPAPERASLPSEPFPIFDDWLQGVESRLPTGLRVLLCLDEYEALDRHLAAPGLESVLDYFRHLQQHRTHVGLLFSGLRSFRALGPTWTSRLVNSRAIRVSFLSLDEFRPILERPIPEFNLRYGPGALEFLLDLTRGQPFLTQAVAMELVDHLNRERRQEANESDIRVAASTAVRSADAYFWDVWDQIGAEGQTVLRSVKAGVLAVPSPVVARLVDLDVLNANGGFAVPLMRDWMATAPIDHV